MDRIKTHLDLDVWKVSMEFAVELYRTTDKLPAAEKYGLSTQIRRAAVSVPSNIAEGAARNSPREFSQFLFIALGSISELETQLELAFRLGFLGSIEREVEYMIRLRKMLVSLINALRKKFQRTQP